MLKKINCYYCCSSAMKKARGRYVKTSFLLNLLNKRVLQEFLYNPGFYCKTGMRTDTHRKQNLIKNIISKHTQRITFISWLNFKWNWFKIIKMSSQLALLLLFVLEVVLINSVELSKEVFVNNKESIKWNQTIVKINFFFLKI